jgi:adenylosuccinate synthase
MPVTIIFGGQFGSEGKGKVAHYFTKKEKADYCIRVGGTNSGHTVYRNGEKIIFRILPTGVIESHVMAVLPAGSYINLNILKEEMKIAGLSDDRLLIDENAVIISDYFIAAEKQSNLRQSIGSTESGTGAAVIARIERNKNIKLLARDFPELKTCDTKKILRDACNAGKKIIAEGTQGFGLSLLHAKEYPYVTSRDTSAAAILSECGLSPFDVENIVMVIRAFPIRVSGDSGELPNEINWDILRDELGTINNMTEYTSCTNRVRRVARFDANVVIRSIICNKPNIIVLNHVDYLDDSCRNGLISEKVKLFIDKVSAEVSVKVNYAGINEVDLVLLEDK